MQLTGQAREQLPIRLRERAFLPEEVGQSLLLRGIGFLAKQHEPGYGFIFSVDQGFDGHSPICKAPDVTFDVADRGLSRDHTFQTLCICASSHAMPLC